MKSLAPESPRRHMTVDQYLAFELQSSARHEYLAGEVFAMTAPARSTMQSRLVCW